MSDEGQTTTTNAPSAAPDDRLHTGGGFHAFQQRVQQNIAKRQAKAAEAPKKQGVPGDPRPRVDQPVGGAKTVQPQPKRSLGEIQADAKAEAAKINNPAGNLANDPRTEVEEPPPDDTQQQQQPKVAGEWTQEDIDLLAKAKAWMEDDYIPEEFLKKLVKMKNGDEFDIEPFEEVQAGRMRQRDHTREMQKIQRERQDWQQREQNYQSHFDAIFSEENEGRAGGDAMYEIFTRAGAFKQLDRLYERWDGDRQQDIDAANGLGLALMRRQNLDPNNPEHVRRHDIQSAIREEFKKRRQMRERDAHTRGIERENARLREANKAKRQEDDNSEYWASQKKAHDQLRPRLFEQMGLDESDAPTMTEYNTQLFALINQRQAKAISPELVRDACRATKEWLKDRKAGGNGKKPPANGGERRPGFNPTLSGGGSVPDANKGKQRWHADSFAQKFGMPRWNR